MVQKLAKLLQKTDELPECQRSILLEFVQYKQNDDCSATNLANYIRPLNLFARFLDGKPFQDVTKEDVLSFVDSLKKSSQEDPDEKWKTSWNEYFYRIKGFYRWCHNKDRDTDSHYWETPEFLTKIKPKKIKRQSPYLDSDVWSEDELLCVVKYCRELRDKVLLTLMWDLAGRNHEITKLCIKHLNFKEQYAIANIPFDTKTGSRTSTLLISFPYVREWLNQHPNVSNPDSFLLYGLTTQKQLSPDTIYNILARIKNRIQKMLADKTIADQTDSKTLQKLMLKPWNPYLVGRHSSITEKTDILLDHQLTSYAGWTPNTKRRATYIHRSGKQTRTPLLEHYGIEERKVKKPTRKTCPKCSTVNTTEATLCSNCSYVLNQTAWEGIEKENVSKMRQEIQDSIKKQMEYELESGISQELKKITNMLSEQQKKIEELEKGKSELTRQRKQEIGKKIYEEINGPLTDDSRIQIAQMILQKYKPEMLKNDFI